MKIFQVALSLFKKDEIIWCACWSFKNPWWFQWASSLSIDVVSSFSLGFIYSFILYSYFVPVRLLPHSIPGRPIGRPRGKWLVHSNQTGNTKAKTILWITQSLVVVVFKSKYYGMIDIWKTWMVEHALRPGSHRVKTNVRMLIWCLLPFCSELPH